MRKTIMLPLLLALAACGATPEEQAAEARAAFAANDFAKARVLLASALQAKPGDKDLLLLQAQTQLALGDGAGAGTSLQQLAAAGGAPQLAEMTAEAALLRNAPQVALDALGQSTSSEAERLRAMVAVQQGDAGKASDHLARAIMSGDNARAFADYARMKLIERDVAAASELADKAAALAPDGIDTLLVKGQIALVRGDLNAALDNYSKASKLYPASLAAMTGRAATLGDLGRFKDMLEVAKAASAVAPRDPAVVYLHARAGVAMKQWEEVRKIIQPLEADLPQVHPLRPLYAEALLKLGQSQLAAAQLGPIARAQPGNRQIAAQLAAARLASGDARGAMAAIQLIADSPEARPEELALMAKAAKAASDPRAEGYAARAARPTPQVIAVDLSEGDAAIKRGDWARAAIAYERILAATDGKNVLVLNNMAYAQSMLGNHAKARDFADRALKQAPDNASVLDTAGWVRFRAGEDLENAKRLLRRAAEQAPQNQTIQMHLAEATRTGG
ncbi:MAG: tetratricopeptide repeat protein [Brevundimonas sp.]|nr:tetratricopeptide repeat protein [Brevundimonas sp.]